MVIAKPMSPASLYDRLAWIAFNPRQFVDTRTYFGPDRRFKIEGYPDGVGRRKGDQMVEIADEVGPALAQDDIDNLFQLCADRSMMTKKDTYHEDTQRKSDNDNPHATRIFSVDTRFQQWRERRAGFPANGRSKGRDRNRGGQGRVGRMARRELAELTTAIEAARLGPDNPEWLADAAAQPRFATYRDDGIRADLLRCRFPMRRSRFDRSRTEYTIESIACHMDALSLLDPDIAVCGPIKCRS